MGVIKIRPGSFGLWVNPGKPALLLAKQLFWATQVPFLLIVWIPKYVLEKPNFQFQNPHKFKSNIK